MAVTHHADEFFWECWQWHYRLCCLESWYGCSKRGKGGCKVWYSLIEAAYSI